MRGQRFRLFIGGSRLRRSSSARCVRRRNVVTTKSALNMCCLALQGTAGASLSLSWRPLEWI